MSDASLGVEVTAAICGAVSGAILGGIAAVVTEKFMEKHRKKQFLALAIGEDCDAFCGDVGAYWATTGLDPLLEKQIIRGFHKILSKSHRYMKLADITNTDEIDIILRQVHIHASGGTFATAARTADPNRPVHVDEQLNRLMTKLGVH